MREGDFRSVPVGKPSGGSYCLKFFLIALFCALLSLCSVFASSLTEVRAITDTSAVVNVNELTLSDYETRTDGKVFSGTNLSTLYEYLTGVKGATLDTVKGKVSGTQAYGNSTIEKMLTSQDIRTNVGTVTGTARDIVVSFGGYDWTVTSLTTDTNGDPIVTLWLANSTETSKWQNYTVTTSTTYGTYPPNMYATSYMRVVTLNAGGSYETSNAAVTSYAQNSSSKWAKFTMSSVSGSLTNYIDTPSQVTYQSLESWPYQIHNSSGYSTTTGTDYYLKNDAYGTPATHTKTTSRTNGGWYSSASTSNYATYATAGQYYNQWANDYLWLPSLTETGRGTDTTNKIYTVEGIWDTTANQRANSATSWLRSGGYSNAYNVIYLTAAGSNGSAVASTAYCVRPALHLNLSSAALSAAVAKPTATGTSTSTAPTAYDGKAHTLTVSGFYAEYMDYTGSSNATVTVNGTTLTVSATNANVNAYSITVTLKSGYVWTDGDTKGQTYEMYIAKADPTVVPKVGTACTSDALPTIALDTGQSTNGTIQWAADATFANAKWEFTPTDTTNYNTKTGVATLNATGHNYSVTWQWATDYSTATASYVCANCGDSGTETVNTKKTVTKIATCSEEGETKYTATLVLDGITVGTDERTVTSPMIAHDYGDPVWTWSADYSTATATLTCSRDATHVLSGNATVSSSITTFPACEDEGVTTYVATVTLNGTKYTDTKTAPIPALGHDWGQPVWNWSGVKLAVATFTCNTDPTHTTQKAATITQSSSTATCTVAGTTVYTATVELDGTTYTDAKTVAGSTVPHDYVFTWTWTIADDYSTASATVYYECANCGDYGTLTATVTRKERPATCEVDGEISFTATVNLQDTDETDTKTKSIPAVGHKYVQGQWQWTGNLSASLSFTCENCGDVQTVSAKSTYRDTVAATADSEGERVYTVTVAFEGFDYTDSKTVKTPKLSETADGAVTVTKTDGTSLTIDYQAVATSEVVSTAVGTGYTGVNAYDVAFSDGTVSLTDGAEVAVTMLITSAYRDKDGLKVYYIDADGTATEIAATKSGDNMTFRTDKLGRFVIACAASAVVPDNPVTPDNPDNPSSDDGTGGSSGGGLPEGFPLWQVIAGGVSIVLAVVFVVSAVRYGKRAKEFAKKRARLSYAPAGVMNGGMLFGISDSIWTTVAVVLMCACLLSFIFMLVNKSRLTKAETAYETANAEAEREERRRRDDEMRMMFMSMGGQRGKVMDDNGNFTEIKSDTDVEAIVTRVVAALLPTIQSNQLPAGSSEEINALKAQQGEILEELKSLRKERQSAEEAAEKEPPAKDASQSQRTVEKIFVKENSEDVIRKLAEHDKQLRELLDREDDGFNDVYTDNDKHTN